MEDLTSRISRKISEENEGEIHITELDFDYAYGQLRLDEQTRNCAYSRSQVENSPDTTVF